MPVVHRFGPYSFFREAWGYTPREVERIRRLVIAHCEETLRRWHEYFDT